jgi:hypothetical protein
MSGVERDEQVKKGPGMMPTTRTRGTCIWPALLSYDFSSSNGTMSMAYLIGKRKKVEDMGDVLILDKESRP